MKKATFGVNINATKQKVWQTLWDDGTYKKWTSVFSEGSYAVSDWKEGSAIHFLNANNDGMYSIIEKCVENEVMNFKHIGTIKAGVPLPLDKDTESWSGSSENYTLTTSNGMTVLTVEMDVVQDYMDYFNEKFPLALNLVKELAEA